VSQKIAEDSPASLQEAYLADPGNPLTLALLAKFSPDKTQALAYCRQALARARAAGAVPQIARVRAIAHALFPDAPQLKPAQPAAPWPALLAFRSRPEQVMATILRQPSPILRFPNATFGGRRQNPYLTLVIVQVP
jgi:hypothetical protein